MDGSQSTTSERLRTQLPASTTPTNGAEFDEAIRYLGNQLGIKQPPMVPLWPGLVPIRNRASQSREPLRTS